MKYLIRAVKYFFYLLVLLTLIITALVAFKLVDADLSTMFVNGYDSLWQIALLMAAFAAVYPRFGYARKDLILPGSYEELRSVIIRVMDNAGYNLETEEGENLTFRRRSPLARALKIWEDRVSFTRIMTGFELEGINKDIIRLRYSLLDARSSE